MFDDFFGRVQKKKSYEVFRVEWLQESLYYSEIV